MSEHGKEYIETDRSGKKVHQINFIGETKSESETKAVRKEVGGDKYSRFRTLQAKEGTLLTVLSFSGGTGSGAIAEMLINGDLVCETQVVVCTADPCMEDSRTYDYVAEMADRFAEAGLEHHIIKTDLYGEFIEAVESGAKRFDNMPFWTKNRKTGKRGRLMQGCTQAYKIKPIRRKVREVLERDHGIGVKGRPPVDSVRTWIGFSSDEVSRIKESDIKYSYMAYPLVAMKMTKADVFAYYGKIGRPLPPRSVCVACFANDLNHYKDMYENRPEDWKKAVKIDDICRDQTCFGVNDECYVSSTLTPLRDLPRMGFVVENTPLFDNICNSGYCFT